jgi:hypothetical protein
MPEISRRDVPAAEGGVGELLPAAYRDGRRRMGNRER